jgi:Zn-dependent M28 family amino/carboxypeptidase
MKTTCFGLLCLATVLFAAEPNAATRRWWAHVQALSNDGLQGRDTGSEGYRKAAAYVVAQFQRVGVKPAGENGWYQSVPLHVVRFRADLSEVSLDRKEGSTKLRWLQQISLPARMNTPESLEGGLVFDGTTGDEIDVKGKILVRINLGTPVGAPAGATAGGRRGGGQAPAGVAAILTVDNPGGVEPPRWPVAYAVAMTLAGPTPAAPAPASAAPLALRFNPSYAEELFAGSGHTYKELAVLAAAGKPLPRFALPATLRAHMKFEAADLASDNIIGVLPGSDPVLAQEYVVVSAHLDGYGVGEPWHGDGIYNGTFDDAAYVATLIELAEKLHESGTHLKRSVLFCVVTGEEKGLLGSRYFAAHPTVAKERMVANVNLDQLRPIFPLKTLTTLALEDSTIGDTVRQVAAGMDIRIQPDPEPERNLLRRSDHWNFMQIGVPAVGFIFGYEKGTAEEAIYRKWYADRYHSPADDLNQPWDPAAAAKFNDFFNRIVAALADAPERPHWKPGSPYAPK